MKTITVSELKSKLEANETIQIIDIRENFEFEDGSLTDVNIPMDDLANDISSINKNEDVVIVCQTGRRASAIVYILEKKYELNNLYCLEGGYEAFIK